jgi:hypothetical protein
MAIRSATLPDQMRSQNNQAPGSRRYLGRCSAPGDGKALSRNATIAFSSFGRWTDRHSQRASDPTRSVQSASASTPFSRDVDSCRSSPRPRSHAATSFRSSPASSRFGFKLARNAARSVLFHRSPQRPVATTAATRATADPAATGTAASGTTPAADPASADRAGAIEVDPPLRMAAGAAAGIESCHSPRARYRSPVTLSRRPPSCGPAARRGPRPPRGPNIPAIGAYGQATAGSRQAVPEYSRKRQFEIGWTRATVTASGRRAWTLPHGSTVSG